MNACTRGCNETRVGRVLLLHTYANMQKVLIRHLRGPFKTHITYAVINFIPLALSINVEDS